MSAETPTCPECGKAAHEYPTRVRGGLYGIRTCWGAASPGGQERATPTKRGLGEGECYCMDDSLCHHHAAAPPSEDTGAPTCAKCGEIAERGPRTCTSEFHAALQGDGEAPLTDSDQRELMRLRKWYDEYVPGLLEQKLKVDQTRAEADARLGAALREAVAKTTRDTDLTFAIARDGALDIWPDTDATRKLAALLRSSPARDATGDT